MILSCNRVNDRCEMEWSNPQPILLTKVVKLKVCQYISAISKVIIFFSCDSSSIGHNVGLSVGRSVCRSVPNEFYGIVMLLLVYNCCYCCCRLCYKNILLSYFAFLAAIAALQVTMSVRNKFHTSYNAATT